MRRPSAAVIAVALVAALAAPAGADFVQIPTRIAATGGPIVITQSSVFVPNDQQTFRACVSFKNVAPKSASFVRFTFRFNDQLGEPLREAILVRTGSFGPGINIEGKMSVMGGNSDSFNNCTNFQMTSIQPSLLIVDVTEVRFEDGTAWKKGDPMPGASPTAAPPGRTPAGSSVTVGGAQGSGGSFSAAAGTFGTIAWLPGTRKTMSTVVDASSQTDADYKALYACNQLAGGGTNCKVIVQMFGEKFRCGAVTLDEAAGKIGSATGPNINDTIKAAQDALVAAGGTLGANTIASSACNAR